MALGNINFEVSDPSFYDSLISDQKKILAKKPKDAMLWVELGRLQDAKAQMTSLFAQKILIIKWIPICTYILVLFGLYFYLNSLRHIVPSIVIYPVLTFCIAITFFMTRLRYPQSGRRHFQKAISLDPANADAYMYLGFIALRKFQRKRAYFLIERACKLGDSRKLERELKTIYQKEFMTLFNQQSQKEKQLYETILPLQTVIKTLKSEIEQLKDTNLAYSKKAKTTKVKTGQIIKQTKIDMYSQMEKLQNEYETQVAQLEFEIETEEAKKELAQKRNLSLSLEIMEAKGQEKKQSFEQAVKQVKNTMGKKLWGSVSEQTRSCLATAEQAFSVLDKNSIQTDFSLVGMELCKALETEINRKLVYPFINNLGDRKDNFLKANKIGESKEMAVYFTILAKVADNQNYPGITSLTLGQYLFVLKKTLEGDYTLDEYGSYLDSIFESSKIVIGRKFLQKLRIVTYDYRNSIVHHTQMNHEQCLKLRELIYAGKNSLLASCH